MLDEEETFTTIRLSKKTKKLLDTIKVTETYEDLLIRLISKNGNESKLN